MLADDDQEKLAFPLLVIVSVTKLEFRPERLASYSYEDLVLACLHNAFTNMHVTSGYRWRAKIPYKPEKKKRLMIEGVWFMGVV